MLKFLQPPGWVKPIGYANGISAIGRQIYVGGQIGWNAQNIFETDNIAEQVAQTLRNIRDVLATDAARPEHITSMTWYLTDKNEYLANLKEIGSAYRSVMGRHFPTMAAVQVSALVEDRAKVEIQAIAVVPVDE